MRLVRFSDEISAPFAEYTEARDEVITIDERMQRRRTDIRDIRW
jgi:hypothetical protein